MYVGHHHLDESCPYTLPASTFLDETEWGEARGHLVGLGSRHWMVRPYVKGNPPVQKLVNLCTPWIMRGGRIQLLNEPNLPHEEFQGGPDEYAQLFEAAARAMPGARLYYAPMSPSGNWSAWYEFGEPRRVIQKYAAGLSVHAYGDANQIADTVGHIRLLYPDKPIWVSEFNFGAGRTVDKNSWAKHQLPAILNWGESVGIEAMTYFAYRWPRPDGGLEGGTPVDAAGSEIERVVAQWNRG